MIAAEPEAWLYSDGKRGSASCSKDALIADDMLQCASGIRGVRGDSGME